MFDFQLVRVTFLIEYLVPANIEIAVETVFPSCLQAEINVLELKFLSGYLAIS